MYCQNQQTISKMQTQVNGMMMQPIQIYEHSLKHHPKNKFTPQEDLYLKMLVLRFGEDWNMVASMMKTRNPRQCRERWINYISGRVSNKPWTEEEDQKLKDLHEKYGPKWVKIASFFQDRSDISLKNRWNIFMRQERRNSFLESLKKENTLKQQNQNVEEKPKALNQPPFSDLSFPQPSFQNYSNSENDFSNVFTDQHDYELWNEPMCSTLNEPDFEEAGWI